MNITIDNTNMANPRTRINTGSQGLKFCISLISYYKSYRRTARPLDGGGLRLYSADKRIAAGGIRRQEGRALFFTGKEGQEQTRPRGIGGLNGNRRQRGEGKTNLLRYARVRVFRHGERPPDAPEAPQRLSIAHLHTGKAARHPAGRKNQIDLNPHNNGAGTVLNRLFSARA